MRARRIALVLAGSLLAAVQLQGSAQAAPSGHTRSCTGVTMDITPHVVHPGQSVGFEATAQNCGSTTLLVRQQNVGPCGFTYHPHRATKLPAGTGFGEAGDLIAPSCLGVYSMHIAMFATGSGTLIDSAVSRFRVVA
jgi:hypothetical protein